MPARNQPWVQEILRTQTHELLHQTSCECALSILKSQQIRGDRRPRTTLEGYPHFLYRGWPKNRNWLPVIPEVVLIFRTDLTARYRGEGTLVPEAGFLELYSRMANPITPWQCSIHPESAPLTFVGVEDWTPHTATTDWFPFRRSLDSRLKREIAAAVAERRKINAAWP